MALWIQTLFGVLILWRPTRILALVSLIFMHLGIALLLGLWPFSLAMIALDMLFIRDSTWRGLWKWFERARAYVRGSDLIENNLPWRERPVQAESSDDNKRTVEDERIKV